MPASFRSVRPAGPCRGGVTVWAAGLTVIGAGLVSALTAVEITGIERGGGGGIDLRLRVAPGQLHRVETSSDLMEWHPLQTREAGGSGEEVFRDPGGGQHRRRFYRVAQVEGDGLTGDHVATEDGDVLVHPVEHASLVLRWKDLHIYNDPVGGGAAFSGIPPANLVLVSHRHGDHFNSATIEAVMAAGAVVVAPQEVFDRMGSSLRAATTVLSNGSSTEVVGALVEAVPAYNGNHPRGAGNGYVLTLGGRRFYFAGDTGDIPEMRALAGIDVAFLPMNIPFTMDIDAAASAVREFRPRVVYPYHFRNQNGTFADLEAFSGLVGDDLGIEVRVRGWY